MKKSFFFILLLVIIAILGIATNPSTEDHRRAVKEKVYQHLEKELSEATADTEDEWGELGNSLGMALGGAVLDPLVKNLIDVDNYRVFSLTRADWEEESHIIGIGAFGKVFLSPKIDEKLEEAVQKYR